MVGGHFPGRERRRDPEFGRVLPGTRRHDFFGPGLEMGEGTLYIVRESRPVCLSEVTEKIAVPRLRWLMVSVCLMVCGVGGTLGQTLGGIITDEKWR